MIREIKRKHLVFTFARTRPGILDRTYRTKIFFPHKPHKSILARTTRHSSRINRTRQSILVLQLQYILPV